jgi:hypothetical protein
VLQLPRFKQGDNINEYNYDCEEQRLLCGFLCGFGFPSPRKTATPRLRNRPNAMNYTIKKIASELYKIRHWEILHGEYDMLPNHSATWFVDPPYQFGGHVYVHSNKKIDFKQLAYFCQSRNGQVIVCEGGGADWLPFRPFINQNVLSGRTRELVWYNQPEYYANEQLTIFK